MKEEEKGEKKKNGGEKKIPGGAGGGIFCWAGVVLPLEFQNVAPAKKTKKKNNTDSSHRTSHTSPTAPRKVVTRQRKTVWGKKKENKVRYLIYIYILNTGVVVWDLHFYFYVHNHCTIIYIIYISFNYYFWRLTSRSTSTLRVINNASTVPPIVYTSTPSWGVGVRVYSSNINIIIIIVVHSVLVVLYSIIYNNNIP